MVNSASKISISCIWSSEPVVEVQPGYAAEVPEVVSDEGQIVNAGCCGDEQVEVLDQHALPAQPGLDLTEGVGDRRGKPQNCDTADEIIDRSLVVFGVGGAGGPVTELGQRDDRNARVIRAGFEEAIPYGIPASQPEDARIGVQQEVYSAGGSARERRAS